MEVLLKTKAPRHLFDYESRAQPLLGRAAFARRLIGSFLAAIAIVIVSLGIGMVGYHSLESLPWIDAFLGAAMILSGMGPTSELHTAAGKIFAGFYALYSGFALLVMASLMVAPIIHRVLHRFHVEKKQ